MAENKVEKTEVAEECPLKEKKVEETKKDEKDEKKDNDTKNVENGDVTVKNGKQEPEEDKEVCEKATKRKSAGGGDAPDGTPAEEAPEKKQKTDGSAG